MNEKLGAFEHSINLRSDGHDQLIEVADIGHHTQPAGSRWGWTTQHQLGAREEKDG